MLKLQNLSLRRGSRELLREANLSVHGGQRVGITGANGVGKSSLFALIRGELAADSGECLLPSNISIAHVAQETPAVLCSALDYVMDGDVQLRQLQQALDEAERQDQGLEMGRLHGELDAIGAYEAPTRAAKLLTGLGFSTHQHDQQVGSFSGGWRMRLNLAQALMCRSDLLLLDEPTNHLDMETVIWLEDWLCAYQGSLLLISHDRDFLDRVATHIAHIEQATLTLYTGNYSDFEKRRAEALAQQQAAYDKQQKQLQHMQKFIDRFGAKATKAKQAQSRVKALERMTLISQAHVDSPFSFEFFNNDKQPDPLLRLDQASVVYGDHRVLDKVKLSVRPGDRIGLLGHNGAGKSSLIKLLAGELATQSGSRQQAKDLQIGYFAQHQLEQLDPQASALLHLQRLDKLASEKELRNFLGGFAFSGDMATAPVAPFSGGEKARLVLAMLVYQKPNLLLLDEPSNHLDLDMRLALTIALQAFEGAMLIVSHDRHMLRTVADDLLLVHDGRVDEFKGDLDDYRQWVRETQGQGTAPLLGKPGVAPQKTGAQTSATRQQLQVLKKQLHKLEKQMDKCTEQLQHVETQLADTALYSDPLRQGELQPLLDQQSALKSQLQQVENDWMNCSEEMETLSAGG